MPKMRRAALYARVSTRDQQTLDMQLKSMREYATNRGWEITMQVQETASGIKKREERKQVLLAAKKRKIDVILVWKLDRWGRSLVSLIHELQELQILGVSFVSITEALDFTTPSGKAMAGMLAVFAQFERDMLSERVKAGIAHARAKGKAHGRPKTAALKKEDIEQMAKKGYSKARIAKELGISRTSVRRLLNDKC